MYGGCGAEGAGHHLHAVQTEHPPPSPAGPPTLQGMTAYYIYIYIMKIICCQTNTDATAGWKNELRSPKGAFLGVLPYIGIYYVQNNMVVAVLRNRIFGGFLGPYGPWIRNRIRSVIFEISGSVFGL